MKKIAFLFTFILCVVLLWAANSNNASQNNLPINLNNEIQSGIKNTNFKSKTLDMVIELEQPTEYQKVQIYNLFNNLCSAAKRSGIKNIPSLIAFINSQIPNNLEDTKDYTLFKHAFPENSGAEAKGTFDCDSRSLLVLSVLEALGKNRNIKMVDLNGHVILTDISTKKYFDLTLDDINIVPNKNELLFSNILFNNQDVKALLLTNIATEYIIKGQGNVITNRASDKGILENAQNLLNEALTLNPRNITAVNNMKYLVSVMPVEEIYDQNGDRDYIAENEASKGKDAIYNVQILAVLVKNYTTNNQAAMPDLFICKELPYCPTNNDSQIQSDFSKAFNGSAYVANYALNDVLQQLFYADFYAEVLRLGNELAKEESLNSIPGIDQFYKQMAISAAHVGDFNTFKQFNQKVKYPDNELYYVTAAVDIIQGKESAENIAHDYEIREMIPFDLYRYIVDGRCSNDMLHARKILDAWDGFPAFRERVLGLIN